MAASLHRRQEQPQGGVLEAGVVLHEVAQELRLPRDAVRVAYPDGSGCFGMNGPGAARSG